MGTLILHVYISKKRERTVLKTFWKKIFPNAFYFNNITCS